MIIRDAWRYGCINVRLHQTMEILVVLPPPSPASCNQGVPADAGMEGTALQDVSQIQQQVRSMWA